MGIGKGETAAPLAGFPGIAGPASQNMLMPLLLMMMMNKDEDSKIDPMMMMLLMMQMGGVPVQPAITDTAMTMQQIKSQIAYLQEALKLLEKETK